MVLSEQIKVWIEQNTLIELQMIRLRNDRRTVFGRIFSYDHASSHILFYNDDTKMLENIHLHEIENANPSSLPPA